MVWVTCLFGNNVIVQNKVPCTSRSINSFLHTIFTCFRYLYPASYIPLCLLVMCLRRDDVPPAVVLYVFPHVLHVLSFRFTFVNHSPQRNCGSCGAGLKSLRWSREFSSLSNVSITSMLSISSNAAISSNLQCTIHTRSLPECAARYFCAACVCGLLRDKHLHARRCSGGTLVPVYCP